VPATHADDFKPLVAGASQEYRFRWGDYLQYRGSRRIKRHLYAVYYNDRLPGPEGKAIPRVTVKSNPAALWLSPDGYVALAR
jgi:hypothetical protein